jgi:predicted NAD/FAD-dependent oxidoreductase
MLLSLPGGGRIGLCGDRFAPGGGVEAAWRSGRMLAGRILAGEGAR